MAIWKDQSSTSTTTKDAAPSPADSGIRRDAEPRAEVQPPFTVPRRPVDPNARESLIAAELTIEGKIVGSGHVRIAGRFKGDVDVQGNLSIEPGASLTGGVRARTVTIGGSLDGNIVAASRVELLETGVLNGDLSAESLTVAAGSRMRGKVEFGWPERAEKAASARDKLTPPATIKVESGSAA